MSCIQTLANQIAESGIKHAFGVPGSGHSLQLIDALEKHNIPFHLTHHEASAALMAGTYGRINNQTGIAISIKGPGLTNMLPGLAFNRFEDYPMLAISEAYAPTVPVQKAHKRINQPALISEVAKGNTILTEQTCFSELQNAACSEAPGPVLLELPSAPVNSAENTVKPAQSLAVDKRVLDLIKQANQPIIIAGTLAVRQNIPDLAHLNIPVFTTSAAKGLIDETAPNAAGTYTGVGLEKVPEHTLIQQADLIIGIGLRNKEVLAASAFACPSINFELIEHPDWHQGFEFQIQTNLSLLNEAFELLQTASWGLDELASIKANMLDHLLSRPFAPAHVMHQLQHLLPETSRLIVDTGDFCTVAEHTWQTRYNHGFLGAGQSRYMNTALPMAISASLTTPDRPTIALLGDGGIAGYIADLTLAQKHQLPLITVFLTDQGFGSIRKPALKSGLTTKPLSLAFNQWNKVIEAMGIASHSIDSENAFVDVVNQWSITDGPLFVQANFNQQDYEKMVEGIR